VVQFVGLSLTIVPSIRPPLSSLVAAVTLAALVYSFVVDVLRLRRQGETAAAYVLPQSARSTPRIP
jgi:hypothetical protein